MPEPRSRFITAGDIQLHVLDWGGSAERVLLLLPGLAGTGHAFDLIAADFIDRYHVVAVDLRGCGLSDQPDDGYDFETLAVDLDQLLQTLNVEGVPVTLVGHSWGGSLALYYAATRAVERLALLDGGIRPMADMLPTWALAEKRMAPIDLTGMSAAQLTDTIEHHWFKALYRPELMPLILAPFDLSEPHQARSRMRAATHAQLARAYWAFNPVDYFAHVTAPTLIVVAVPPGGEIIHFIQFRLDQALARLSNARLVIMRDTFHDLHWHRPREIVAVLNEFL